jgi:methylthioribose-1-phosphate isomerase
LQTVSLTRSSAANPAFDITPGRLVSAYVTDRGVIGAIEDWDFGA